LWRQQGPVQETAGADTAIGQIDALSSVKLLIAMRAGYILLAIGIPTRRICPHPLAPTK